MHVWMHGWMDVLLHGCIDRWTLGWMHGLTREDEEEKEDW